MRQKPEFLLGVDVGTGSARAGIFDPRGKLAGHGVSPIEIHRPALDFVEQSSEGIWRACGEAIAAALASASIDPASIAGMSFDATCSLVALDASDRPVTISPSGQDRWNVVVWMDHRASREAAEIDAAGHQVLRYVGGTMSPEMEPPKLLWIRRNLPASWRRAARFLDLADFLTYRSTGSDVRSACTTVCKWTYLGHEGRWARDFFSRIGLEDLLGPPGDAPGSGGRAGTAVKPMGTPLGGLTPASAAELGLAPGTPVGVGIIDAHAGGLGLFGIRAAELQGAAEPQGKGSEGGLEEVLALIGGTSSCHLAVSREPRFVPGIWGPYHSALIPGMWLTEGGQSATGSLLDHVIADSAAAEEAHRRARGEGRTVYEILNDEVRRLRRSVAAGEDITGDLHVLPYFHGNRSPRADPSLRGVVSGLSLDASIEGLARRYLATIQAIAHGTRHIIETMNSHGFRIDTVLACGGGTKNPLWLEEHAAVTGRRLVLPREPEAVLLGTAMLGAVAGGVHPTLLAALSAMGGAEKTIAPDPSRRAFHERKARVFHSMHEHFIDLRKIMGQSQLKV